MEEIKCTIIQDLLPLYVDEVASIDTKEMVDKHLNQCDNCKKELEFMKQDIYIPIEGKTHFLNRIGKKWRKKKIMTSIISVLLTSITLIGVFSYIFYYETVIPYDKNLVKIEEQNDNQLNSHYFGKSYAGVNVTHPILLQIDGEKKNVSFIFYTKTIADSPSRNLISNEQSINEEEYIFNLFENEKIDAVYYVEYDVDKIISGKDSWESTLERGELIWEK